MSHVVTRAGSGGELSRREALRKGLFVAGAVWAVPAVSVLNMDAAAADLASPVPQPTDFPGPSETPTPTPSPSSTSIPSASPSPSSSVGGVKVPGQASALPETGGAPIGAVVAGASLVAGGLVARAAARKTPATDGAPSGDAGPRHARRSDDD
jgi:hypothetical protein